MDEFEKIAMDTVAILDDIEFKAAQKKEYEMRAERIGIEINKLKGKVGENISALLNAK